MSLKDENERIEQNIWIRIVWKFAADNIKNCIQELLIVIKIWTVKWQMKQNGRISDLILDMKKIIIMIITVTENMREYMIELK